MNVIGSRPTGWWRDRPGAMRQLVEELEAFAARSGDDVTVVFDGEAVRARERVASTSVRLAPRPERGRRRHRRAGRARRRPGRALSRHLGRRPRSPRPRGRGDRCGRRRVPRAGSTVSSRPSTTARAPRPGTTVTWRITPRSGRCVGARSAHAPQHLAQHGPHLDLGERRADAAAHAAAERDPGVGLWRRR